MQVGSLVVRIGSEISALRRGFKEADTLLAGFGKTAKIAGIAAGTALAAGMTAAGVAIKHTINVMDDLSKLAQRTGFPTDQLTKWKFAADLAGTSIEEMSVSLRRLAGNMDDAQKGTGNAAVAFQRIGVSLKNADGSMKTSEQVMLDVADKFARMEDGATKSALAMDLFGRSGVSMIPMLNAGARGLQDMFDQAKRLGLVFSAETARAAEDFNDNLTRLYGAINGVVIQITAALLPSMVELTDKLVAVAADGKTVPAIVDAIKDGFEELSKATIALARNASTLITAMSVSKNFIGLLMNVVTHDAPGAIQNLKDLGVQLGMIGDAVNNVTTVSKQAAADPAMFSEDFWKGTVEAMTPFQAGAAANIELTKKLTDEANQAAQAFDNLGLEITKGVLTPLEQMQNAMSDAGAQLRAGNITAETYGRVWRQNAQAVANQYVDTANVVGNALGTIFEDNKAVAVAQAIINTLQGITQALTLPFPLNWIQGAAVAAAGFAQVAKIKSTRPGADSGSATSTVKGGASDGGGGAGTDPAAQLQDRVINIQMLGAGRYTKQEVRDLMQQMVDEQRDGARLVLAKQ